jgi:hypothetical protein
MEKVLRVKTPKHDSSNGLASTNVKVLCWILILVINLLNEIN